MERLQHVMRARGLGYEEVEVVTRVGVERVAKVNVADLVDWAGAWRRVVGMSVFEAAAEAYKRASKIVEMELDPRDGHMAQAVQKQVLREPAEVALRSALDRVTDDIEQALNARQPGKAIEAIASIQPLITRFFDEVRVVVEDGQLKNARLSLLTDFRDAVARFGDPSVLAQRQTSAT
jgi:glycyl-tRNA synthetase beta chain